MKLTERELKVVTQMRNYERQWRWGRWLMLFMGIFSAGVAIFFCCVGLPRVQSEETAKAAFDLALLFPMILIFAGVATQLFIVAIRDWHGNLTRSLLLRLIDAATDEQNRKDRTP